MCCRWAHSMAVRPCVSSKRKSFWYEYYWQLQLILNGLAVRRLQKVWSSSLELDQFPILSKLWTKTTAACNYLEKLHFQLATWKAVYPHLVVAVRQMFAICVPMGHITRAHSFFLLRHCSSSLHFQFIHLIPFHLNLFYCGTCFFIVQYLKWFSSPSLGLTKAR